MKAFSPVTHIIFDLDGLVLDTEVVYEKGNKELLARYGKVFSNDVRIKIQGTQEWDMCRILVEEYNLPKSVEEFYKEFVAYFNVALKESYLKPGAEKLIRHFYDKNIPIAIATSSTRGSFDIKMDKYPKLCSCFNHFVMGGSDDEVVKGKPAPDIFIVAARRFPTSPSPRECLVFEDSYNGVLAAKGAGMQVVMVPEMNLVSLEKQKEATLVLKSLEDFVPEDFGLPPFDS